MTPLAWFNSYEDALQVAHHFMQCTTLEQSRGFYGRMMERYRNNKGAEYATAVASHVAAMLEGVEAMRQGEVP